MLPDDLRPTGPVHDPDADRYLGLDATLCIRGHDEMLSSTSTASVDEIGFHQRVDAVSTA
jgi:hypothetical protein